VSVSGVVSVRWECSGECECEGVGWSGSVSGSVMWEVCIGGQAGGNCEAEHRFFSGIQEVFR